MDLIGLYAQLACIWEATARKPGNVHRYRDFEDVGYVDFLQSAAAIGPVMAVADRHSVGQTVYEAVCLTRTVAPNNTNLGMVLLLAPPAAVPADKVVRVGALEVLERLDVDDARLVYEAIRLANPAGLGRVEQQDVSAEPTLPLRQVMALAADRDLVARQYANGFREVFDDGVPALVRGLEQTGCLEGSIIFCHLSLLAKHPDSLIARKRGVAEAEEASRRARLVLRGDMAVDELDAWLRAEGHSRNPGTTADLVTAVLFVALREGILSLPPAYPWAAPEPQPGVRRISSGSS
jgi:triphosphoribosyl-dephospho-CoA synthase